VLYTYSGMQTSVLMNKQSAKSPAPTFSAHRRIHEPPRAIPRFSLSTSSRSFLANQSQSNLTTRKFPTNTLIPV
jgi:hypothetical protein